MRFRGSIAVLAFALFSLLLPDTRVQAAPPTFVNISAIAAAATGAADPTVTLPAHLPNDILLLATVVRSGTATVATPAGWTQIGTPTVRAATATYQFFWTRAGATTVPNPLIDRTGTTGDVYAAVINYRGAIVTGDPWEVKGTVATGTADPSVITGITTLTADSLVVVAVAGEDNNNGAITTTGTDPAAYTEHYLESATGADGTVTFSEFARATAGATGNVSVDWDTAIPVGFGGIVLALKPKTTFAQAAYRFFDNLDSTDVGTALAAQDTAASLVSSGATFRLRMLLHAGVVDHAINGQAFKLQFAVRSGTCDTAFSGETYADVTAATAIAYNNNATPADGANLTANASDPTHGGDTVVSQTYQESNNFNNSAAISAGQDGKWDFALVDNSAPNSITYCFRVVTDTGAVLDTYSVVPEITTARSTVFYFHDAASPDAGTLPSAATLSATTPDVSATGAGTNRDMNQSIGALQASGALSTNAVTTLQRNWFRRFLSRPLAAQTLPTGVWTIQGGASESNGASNMLLWGAVITVWRPSTGATVATLLDNPVLGTVEPGTTQTNVLKATASITGVAVNDGDILVVELWAQNTQGNATARTNTIFYDGTTEGSTTTNAAYLQAPKGLTFYRSTTQSAYRLFNNANSTDVGTALAAQDTAAVLATTGAAFRLRTLLHVSDIDLGIGGQAFKLQFVGKGTGTCAAPTGGTPASYTDVTGATAIAYNNNAPADGATLTANVNDPTHGADTVVIQTYEESNNFTNIAAINAGQDGKWDFALLDNGAPGGTTYCLRVVKDTGTALDFYLAYPEITTKVAVGSFNAFETSTAALATTGVITTRISGTGFSLDVVAISGGAQSGSFTDAVTVELLGNNTLGVALDAQNCPTSFVLQQASSPADPTITGGRSTVSFAAVANSWRDVRVRMKWPTTSPTVTWCSTDNFAIRPNTLASFAVTDTDWTTTGSPGARALDLLSFAATTPLHKAGRPFSVRATAVNSASVLTSNYTGAPTAALSACAGTACTATFGTLTLSTTFVGGQLASDVASYNNVGAFRIRLEDTDFASVDSADTNGDCTGTGRYVCSASLDVGRFVPDHFTVSLTTPEFGPACSPFTYVGQIFNYATPPQITVRAKNFAGTDTTLYTDNTKWWRITNAVLDDKTYTSAPATLNVSGTPGTDPVIADLTGGVGTLSFSSGTGFLYTRSTPTAPFDAEIGLSISVKDADGVTYASNPVQFGTASAGLGIAFTGGGKAMRFGRLRLQNAVGSEKLDMPIPLVVQHWNGSAFETNSADGCTSLSVANLSFGAYTGGITAGNMNSANIGLGGAFASGVGSLKLTKPSPAAASAGSTTLTIDLAAESKTYLQGNWGVPTYTGNPSARAAFGLYGAQPRNFIFFRENY